MAKDVAVVFVHGMGETEDDFDEAIKNRMYRRLGGPRYDRVYWDKAYYQGLLQENQRELFDVLQQGGDLDWTRLRKFLLFGFGDAAASIYRPEGKESIYFLTQKIIFETLSRVADALSSLNRPVIIVAQSLGGKVLSNYIWGAQQNQATWGIFGPDSDVQIPDGDLGRVIRLKTLRYLYTTGCNIPIFVSGMPLPKIKPFKVSSGGWDIHWENYYDADDALGWPLKPINAAYQKAVKVEKSINVGGVRAFWNPLSHMHYWRDDDFLDPLEDRIRSILV
ncbi:MAG: hypothetical protein AAF358_08900 [Pseudomonadota bacterium]